MPLATGAELRMSGPDGGPWVLCMNGGTAREVPGTWSATVEWLVGRLAPRFPGVRFGELRYRVKSWKRLPSCIDDAAAAIESTPGGGPRALVGFSMGGAVAIASAGHDGVQAVVALAPWIPGELGAAGLEGRTLTVIQGSVDGYLPGIPGVSAKHSRAGFDRLRAIGVDGRYELITGGMHGTALRAPWGSLVPLPRAEEWARLTGDALAQPLS